MFDILLAFVLDEKVIDLQVSYYFSFSEFTILSLVSLCDSCNIDVLTSKGMSMSDNFPNSTKGISV